MFKMLNEVRNTRCSKSVIESLMVKFNCTKYRVLDDKSCYTMDVEESRINIKVDGNNKVVDYWVG